MRIHHLCVATMCPPAGRLVNARGRLVCHALLLELDDGLVLVETGLGEVDLAEPARLGPTRWLGGFDLDPEGTARSRIRALGYDPADVRHVVLTHLDLDHAGGLSDFPEAAVHLHALELEVARRPTGRHSMRYRPAQWAHGPRWQPSEASGEPWLGFEAVRDLPGLPPEVLLVPLFGHSPGHCGVAVDRGDRWLLHCGDAYFHAGEMDSDNPRGSLGLSLFQRLTNEDRRARIRNQDRLRALRRDQGDQVELFCAHDPDEFDRYA
jgi:glyoxylase-like metal-dependent hydrolase (beta-lactamase superfamily II)